MTGTKSPKPNMVAISLTMTKLAKTTTRPISPVVKRELALEILSGEPSEVM